MTAAGNTTYALRYYAGADAFTLERVYDGNDTAVFPLFVPVGTNEISLLAYTETYMLHGSLVPSLRACVGQPSPADAGTCDLTGIVSSSPHCDYFFYSGPISPRCLQWCCDETDVVQIGSSVTTTAAYGNGTGVLVGDTLNMTFTNIGFDIGTIAADCNSIAWAQSKNSWKRKGVPTLTDGPVVPFDATSIEGAAIAYSATDDFTVHEAACSLDANGAAGFGGAVANAAAMPLGTSLVSVLLGRPGVRRVTAAWGALMRQAHNTSRARGVGTRALSYWT